MKLRDLPRALGFAAAPREYPSDIQSFTLATDGEVRFARWRHPGETPKTITQESVNALRAFLREGDVALDIGAHTGDSTMPIALAVGPRGTVFALEPNPYVFKVLALNATLNPRTTRIVPLMFAAMPTDGEFEFEYSDEGYCNGGFHQSISRWRHGHFSKLRVQGRNLADYLRANAPDDLSTIAFHQDRHRRLRSNRWPPRCAICSSARGRTSRRKSTSTCPRPSVRATSTTFAGCATSCFKCGEVEYPWRAFCVRLPSCPGGGTSTCSRCRRSSHKDV